MPEHILTYWRLGFQLRSDKIFGWYDELSETLKIFFTLNPKSNSLSIRDEIYLTALKSHSDLWNKSSKNSKTKFRKLTREIALTENFLTVNLLKSSEISKDYLRNELDFWLMSLNVVDSQ